MARIAAAEDSKLQNDLIDITPAPGLTLFDALHDRMAGCFEVPGGVLADAGIAAAHMPADQALTQMDPVHPPLQTLYAAFAGRLYVWVDLTFVLTLHGWHLRWASLHCRARCGERAQPCQVIAAPNLIWLAGHQFINLKMEHFIHARDVRHGRADGYYTDQMKFTFFAFPLAVAGLVSLIRSRRFRLLSALYLGPFLLLSLAKGRGYYLLPAYPVLFAAGAVALERVLAARTRGVRIGIRVAVVLALLVNAIMIARVYLPIWKPGSERWNWQMKHSSDMADEVGWPELVAQVAAVRDTLTPAERGSLAVLANNYGEAGAVALYGPQYGLPTPISSTNTFHLRGYGAFEPQTVIVLGDELDNQLKNFEDCRVAAQVHVPYGVLNEESRDHRVILVCHHLRSSWPMVWSRSQEFG